MKKKKTDFNLKFLNLGLEGFSFFISCKKGQN